MRAPSSSFTALATEPPSSSAFTLGDLVAICWPHKWSALVVALLVGSAIWYGSRQIQPLYEASAVLQFDRPQRLIQFGGESTSDRELVQTALFAGRDLLLADQVLRRAYDQGPLAKNPIYAKNDPLTLMVARLTITIPPDTTRMVVAFQDEERERARLAAQTLVDVFLETYAKQQADQIAKGLASLSDQVQHTREQVDQARGRERELRNKLSIISTNPEDNYLAMRFATLHQQRETLNLQLINGRQVIARLDQVDQQLPAGTAEPKVRLEALLAVPEIRSETQVVEIQKELLKVQEEQLRLAETYLDKHPRMREIAQLLVRRQVELAAAVDAVVLRLRTQLRDQENASQGLDAQLREATVSLTAYREAQLEIQAQSKDARAQEELLAKLTQSLNEQTVLSQLSAGRMSLLDRAQSGLAPINIKPRLFLAVAIAGGLFAGLCTAIVLHLLDHQVRSAARAAHLAHSVILGRLPRVRAMVAPHAIRNERSQIYWYEAIQAVRTTLQMRLSDTGATCLAVISCGPGEGKSTVALHLAAAFASTQRRVLLVDADLRRPSLARSLALPVQPGLTHALQSNGVPEPLATDIPHLFFLGAGEPSAKASELLGTPHFSQLIAVWRAMFDVVIIDTPPLGLVSDALLVGEHVDGLVWVIRAHAVRREVVERVRQTLGSLAQRLQGIIYNREPGYRPALGYVDSTYEAYLQAGAKAETAQKVAVNSSPASTR